MLQFIKDPPHDYDCCKQYVCYMIVSTTSRRTYVGCTNNVKKRLRQHNGEIKGGARYTHQGRPWILKFLVIGFGPSRSLACKFETHWKRSSFLTKSLSSKSVSLYDEKMPVQLLRNPIECMNFLNLFPLEEFLCYKNRIYGIVASSFYLQLFF